MSGLPAACSSLDSLFAEERTELLQATQFLISGNMETNGAIHALAALAHEGRLNAFRLLIKAGKAGISSGEIARALGVPANTLSNSLTVLAHAGLVESRREGKLAIYTVRFGVVTELLGFLIEDCCAASEEICAPLSEISLKSCC